MYYLVGTKSSGEPAKFPVTRGQFDEEELWHGEGEPRISIDDAIAAARLGSNFVMFRQVSHGITDN